MIHLKRSRDLASIHADFTGNGLFTKLVALAQARISNPAKIDWEGILGDWKKMKPFLQKDSIEKCAYCEAPTSIVAYGDVEHFRPKSIYWWLAVCVDNYVYSCQLCNQKYKSDNFPIAGTQLAGPKLPATLPTSRAALKRLVRKLCPDPATADEAKILAEWLSEDPDLPHPYLEDPESLFAWAVVETNEEVRVVPPDNASPRAKRAVKAADDYLGINRELLARQRYIVYRALVSAVRTWKMGDALSLEQIQFMCQAKHPFAGMCRYYARLAGAPI